MSLLFCLPFCVYGPVVAQSYIRGQVVDQSNNPLLGVQLYQPASQKWYSTGSTGAFGFPSPYSSDSVIFTLQGYQELHAFLPGSKFSTVVMKMLPSEIQARKPKLLSQVGMQPAEQRRAMWAGGETYSSEVENEPTPTDQYPSTGFALNIDKASYSNIRRFITLGMKVPPDAVRIEELLNYFNLDYSQPTGDNVFALNSQLTDCPWNANDKLLILHMCGQKLNLETLPPSNFVFLLDISGSMFLPNKLPLIKAAFRQLTVNLRDKDTVSIVVYGGTVATMLEATPGNNRQKILDAIDGLEPNGDTPGAAGILLAYSVARQHFIKGGNNRVILATDGDFNVGPTGEKELEDIIGRERLSGIYLTCLGVGMGNYKDSKLEALAKKGNGNFSYLDNVQEGEKVLVKELSQNLYTIARDVYAAVQFNKEAVKSYRLVGFENKKDAMMDTAAEIDGGEVGSGFSMMAMFEVEGRVDLSSFTGNLANVKLSYRLPTDSILRMDQYPCNTPYRPLASLDKSYSFAAALAMYGMILRESKYAPGKELEDVVPLAYMGLDPQNFLENDFMRQLDKTIKLYGNKHKHGKWNPTIQ